MSASPHVAGIDVFPNLLSWPLGAKGNEVVDGPMKQTPNSVGYVELVHAIQNRRAYRPVRNCPESFVNADLQSVTAPARAAAKHMPDDFHMSITNPMRHFPKRSWRKG